MSGARDDILGGIRRALRRGPLLDVERAELAERVAVHRRNLVPARAASLGRKGRIELFVAMAEAVQTTVARVGTEADIPAEIARYLAAENLPAELVVAPDASLDGVPWETRPLLQIRRGRAEARDAVSLTPCLAGIAETGTLMLTSGAGTPSTLNFLPDTHIVVLHAGRVVASYEDGWDLLRMLRQSDSPPLPSEPSPAGGGGQGGGLSPQSDGPEGAHKAPALPRTVNLITGPSRTGDIEQRIQLGAHGPRRLHVVLVEDAPGHG